MENNNELMNQDVVVDSTAVAAVDTSSATEVVRELSPKEKFTGYWIMGTSALGHAALAAGLFYGGYKLINYIKRKRAVKALAINDDDEWEDVPMDEKTEATPEVVSEQ